MPSYLTFPSTEQYRKVLMARNLAPYTVPGVYTPNVNQINYEVVLRDESVVDSPDELIAKDPFADLLYPLNPFGPEGGFSKTINAGGLANTKSNLGPYDVQDAKLPELSLPYEKQIPTNNVYTSGREIQLYSVDSDLFNGNPSSKNLFIPYYEPWSFVPSTYTAYDILLQDDPNGDMGKLSQDSFIAQLGARQLKSLLQDNNATQSQNRLNSFNANVLRGVGAGATSYLRGTSNQPYTSYKITLDADYLAGNYLGRLSGSYSPSSTIPGDYFEDEQYLRYPGTVNQISNALNIKSILGPINQYLGPKVFRRQTPSEVFIQNTGSGQVSQLFISLNYNKYKPNYNRNLLQDIGQGALNVLGLSSQVDVPTNYYVGSSVQDPTFIESPLGQVPYDSLGRDTQSIVVGPTEMSNLFENNSTNALKFGLNGKAFEDGAGLSGGLVWSSPKYSNAGYRALIGGDQGTESPSFNEVKSKIDTELSIEYGFKEGSILDITQKLLDSTPRGGKRLSHVGNAINQLSKVFNDGYKEITKGSKVLSYVDQNGAVVGTEYCRVFTKDTPYYTYQDLQKYDGNIRKFTYSVLDNTFNLNIAPLKTTSTSSSTNIVNGSVKKYMFSIENLAWRTSNRPGFTVLDLPECERGPNGGRVMWFPPYDLAFSENITPNFESNNFLGRPEPVYTYKNTQRSGTLSWKIVVDHPSILNVIADKELKNLTDQQINGIVDSFFAGCKKYDIYTLAAKYNTIPINELYAIQEIILNETSLKPEDVESISNVASKQTEDIKQQPPSVDLTKYNGLAYYFDNDSPDPNSTSTTTTADYLTLYNEYIGNKSTYENNAPTESDKSNIDNFFTSIIETNFKQNDDLLNDLVKLFEGNSTADGKTNAFVTITLQGSASAPATAGYNQNLSERRASSVKNYFTNWNSGKLAKYITSNNLVIQTSGTGEQVPNLKVPNAPYITASNCTDLKPNATQYEKIYSPNAMACRRVSMSISNPKINPPEKNPTNDNTQTTPTSKTPPGYTPAQPVPANISTQQKLRDGISKKILRTLLSECSYFEAIQKEDPMFYGSIQKQLKHFSPAFHAITPEGLNSRLTFLQQCTRPGDTIPTIGLDGKPKYTNSVNTSFGAPPVLILRIGDFYNTKIVPTSLNIQYEPLVLDINPEGIGVQPMIAKISLSFNFVGGSGLKEPIDQLQNALSFNYYANTEMYDERADATDPSYKKIDADVVKAILDQSKTLGVNNVNNNIKNDGGKPIGDVVQIVQSDAGASGNTTYQKIMDGLLTNGQNYINSVYNKIVQLTKDNNFQVYTCFIQDRKYSSGVTKEFTTPKDLKIVGKPYDIESRITKLFDDINNDIDNVKNDGDDGLDFIKQLFVQNYSKNSVKKVKESLKNAVNKNKTDIINSTTSVLNEITNSQTDLVRTFRKLDIIDSLTDGYIQTNQSAEIYNLTATTEVQSGGTYADTYAELVGDYDLAVDSLSSFYNDLKSSGFIEIEYNTDNLRLYDDGNTLGVDSCCINQEKRFYMAMSKVILDPNKLNSFIEEIIPKDIQTQNVGGKSILDFTKDYFSQKRNYYQREYTAEQKFVKNFETTSNYKDKYKTWKPFVSGKVRKFLFSGYVDGTSTQVTYLQNLYKDGNSNTSDQTFNGKNKLN
jgi:outer membrane protein OmpA-like peptidoglycan-associated protein/gas vesicle protein